MKQFNQFAFNNVSVPILGSLGRPFVPCSDVLVKCLGHSIIQDSHFFRENRTNTDLYLFDGTLWFFTRDGLTETLKRSHKKNSKPVLAAFEKKMEELQREQDAARSSAPFQTLLAELSASEQLVRELEEHKDMLSVQHMLFKGQQFKIYGTREEPLFLVNDIACGLLGFRDIADSQFFRDNRDNTAYVITREIPGSSQELQERFKKSNKEHIYFFTEAGLYSCLMRSNKPIAELFKDEICALLKNIRLGFVKLVVSNAQAVSESIQRHIKDVQGLAAQHSSLLNKLGIYTDIAKKSKRLVSLYELKTEDGKTYRGQTNDFGRRINQHRRASCSPVIRDAYRRGMNVSESVVRQVEVYNENDIKYEEAKFISEVDPAVLLNKAIPKPDMSRVTVYTEEPSPLAPELDAISEAVTLQEGVVGEEYKQRTSGHVTRSETLWKQQYDSLVAFVSDKSKMPSKHSQDKSEAKLGLWIADMRKAHSGKKGSITPEQVRLLELVKGWKWSKAVQIKPASSFTDMVQDLSDYVREYTKLPVPENTNPRARSLALWIIETRAANTKGLLTAEQKEKLESIQGWEWVSRDGWLLYFRELQQFISKAGKLPTSNSGDKSQSVVYKWTTAQRTEYRNGRLNSERVALMESLAGWSWQTPDQNEQWMDTYTQVKAYMQANGKVPTAGPLGKWSGHQREQYAHNTLIKDRLELLKQLGPAWYWSVKEKLFGQ